MSLTQCPTCGAALEGRAVCAHCGTLVSIEFALSRAKTRGRNFIDVKIQSLGRELRPHHFLWACAVVPFFILPPLVSLIFAIGSLRRTNAAERIGGLEWMAVIAAINIVLSVLVLAKFHFSLQDLAAFVGDIIRSVFSAFMRLPNPPPAGPKLTPV